MKSMTGFLREMKKNGYSVRTGTRLKGKSGTMHEVDIIFEKKEGGDGVVLMKSRGKDVSLEIIQAFLTGVDLGAMAVYVTGRNVDAVGRKLLKEYKMSRLSPVKDVRPRQAETRRSGRQESATSISAARKGNLRRGT
jgi:hypothetical protein